MGVPAFYRWLSLRYPKTIRDCVEEPERVVAGERVPACAAGPNPNGMEFDNLYLDMNGIIHPCFHPEDRPAPTTEAEVFEVMFSYIDRLVSIVRPRKVLYMGIDGVAPRAKMNQQRSRRFRAAQDAREKEKEEQRIREELKAQGLPVPPTKKNVHEEEEEEEEVEEEEVEEEEVEGEDGRDGAEIGERGAKTKGTKKGKGKKGKKEEEGCEEASPAKKGTKKRTAGTAPGSPSSPPSSRPAPPSSLSSRATDRRSYGISDSNVITPGTPFMHRLSAALQYYIHSRLSADPGWRGLRVFLSDANCPGEGEHKIMAFIRAQRADPAHDPNTRHCIYGLDADLIMLALSTHEPRFAILREVVTQPGSAPAPEEVLRKRAEELAKRAKERGAGGGANGGGGGASPSPEDLSAHKEEIARKPFQFLLVGPLREYLTLELSPRPGDPPLPFPLDPERLLDDFVFMCCFVGNDFLPHMPTLEIREGAIELMLKTYRKLLPTLGGHLVDGARIRLDRVQRFIADVGANEQAIFARRSRMLQRQKERRKHEMRAKEQLKAAGATHLFGTRRVTDADVARRAQALLRGKGVAGKLRGVLAGKDKDQGDGNAKTEGGGRGAGGERGAAGGAAEGAARAPPAGGAANAALAPPAGGASNAAAAAALRARLRGPRGDGGEGAKDEGSGEGKGDAKKAPEGRETDAKKAPGASAPDAAAFWAAAAGADAGAGAGAATTAAGAATTAATAVASSPSPSPSALRPVRAGKREGSPPLDLATRPDEPSPKKARTDGEEGGEPAPHPGLGVRAPRILGTEGGSGSASASAPPVSASPASGSAPPVSASPAPPSAPLSASSPGSPPSPSAVASAIRARLSAESRESSDKFDEMVEHEESLRLGESGWKARYYRDKFGASSEAEARSASRRAALEYVRGLAWVMAYYFEGVPSWTWFYPFHYAPFASDLTDLKEANVSFELGQPFKPFDQLMGVFPADSAHALPKPYRWLFTDPASPILDFYPRQFQVDMNGKRFAWQGVALLPFIDERRLLKATREAEKGLGAEERRRNTITYETLFVRTDDPLAPEMFQVAEQAEERLQNAQNAPASSPPPTLALTDANSPGLVGRLMPLAGDPCPPTIPPPFAGIGPTLRDNVVVGAAFALPEGKVKHVSKLLKGAVPDPPVVTPADVPVDKPLWHEDTRGRGGGGMGGGRGRGMGMAGGRGQNMGMGPGMGRGMGRGMGPGMGPGPGAPNGAAPQTWGLQPPQHNQQQQQQQTWGMQPPQQQYAQRGPPQAQYGAPPGAYGGPPAGYGAPPGAYSAAPAGPYQQPAYPAAPAGPYQQPAYPGPPAGPYQQPAYPAAPAGPHQQPAYPAAPAGPHQQPQGPPQAWPQGWQAPYAPNGGSRPPIGQRPFPTLGGRGGRGRGRG